jgi:hypothetical protein
MTSPSPTIFGPFSSGGFFRASSAASASANWLLSFSNCFRKEWVSEIVQIQVFINIFTENFVIIIYLQGFDRLYPRKQPSGSSQQQLDPSAHQTASRQKMNY